MKVQWYHEGEELLEDTNIKIEKSSTHTQLVLTKCRRKSSGEIKIKIKNECGTTEATTDIVVLGLLLACSTLHPEILNFPKKMLFFATLFSQINPHSPLALWILLRVLQHALTSNGGCQRIMEALLS